MFHKILVALDNSLVGRAVFAEALELAKATGGQLLLLHVLSHDQEGTPPMPSFVGLDYGGVVVTDLWSQYRIQWEAFAHESLVALEQMSAEAKAAGIEVEFSQNTGSPSREICEMAQTWGSDLVMVGRRGYSGLKELVLGSVSNYVLHNAPCSVLIVQEKLN